MKFKVGDKVRIKNNLKQIEKEGERRVGIRGIMVEMENKVFVIRSIGTETYYINGYYFIEGMVESVNTRLNKVKEFLRS